MRRRFRQSPDILVIGQRRQRKATQSSMDGFAAPTAKTVECAKSPPSHSDSSHNWNGNKGLTDSGWKRTKICFKLFWKEISTTRKGNRNWVGPVCDTAICRCETLMAQAGFEFRIILPNGRREEKNVAKHANETRV